MDYNIFHLSFRHGITFKEFSGESEKVTEDDCTMGGDNLTTILAGYQLKDIFNAGEFGFFYEAMPSKPLHFRGKRCSGGKHSKVQLTGIAESNPLGEKIPMFVIGKSASSRCFKQFRKPPLQISISKESMNGWDTF